MPMPRESCAPDIPREDKSALPALLILSIFTQYNTRDTALELHWHEEHHHSRVQNNVTHHRLGVGSTTPPVQARRIHWAYVQ